jgi:hypothetical protein
MRFQSNFWRVPVRGIILIFVLALAGCGDQSSQNSMNSEDSLPRLTNGKPDLTGYWNGRASGGLGSFGNLQTSVDLGDNIAYTVNVPARKKDFQNFENDAGVQLRANENMPLYKPEYWEKVRENDLMGNYRDTHFLCLPEGLPRIGAPDKIMQNSDEVAFFYGTHNTSRIIPTDGRERDPIRANDQTWYGDSLGHWEGDTLVVETVGFNGLTWLGWSGWPTSSGMKVTERLTREEDQILYEVTVEDPILVEPWSPGPQVLYLNPDVEAARLWEDPPCVETDIHSMPNPLHRG